LFCFHKCIFSCSSTICLKDYCFSTKFPLQLDQKSLLICVSLFLGYLFSSIFCLSMCRLIVFLDGKLDIPFPSLVNYLYVELKISSFLFLAILGIELSALHLLDKCSCTRVVPSSPFCFSLFFR
jgi:hypothetical protein